MVSKCANPSCFIPFLYLGKGTLFVFETSSDSESAVGAESLRAVRKGTRKLETFWLCDRCSSRLVVRIIRGAVEVVPRCDGANHAMNVPARKRDSLRKIEDR